MQAFTPSKKNKIIKLNFSLMKPNCREITGQEVKQQEIKRDTIEGSSKGGEKPCH